jgi:hypothetical protein
MKKNARTFLIDPVDNGTGLLITLLVLLLAVYLKEKFPSFLEGKPKKIIIQSIKTHGQKPGFLSFLYISNEIIK